MAPRLSWRLCPWTLAVLMVTRRGPEPSGGLPVEAPSTRTLPPRFMRRAWPAVRPDFLESSGEHTIGLRFRSRLPLRLREMPLVLLARLPLTLARIEERSPVTAEEARRPAEAAVADKTLLRRRPSFLAECMALRICFGSSRLELDSESDPEAEL